MSSRRIVTGLLVLLFFHGAAQAQTDVIGGLTTEATGTTTTWSRTTSRMLFVDPTSAYDGCVNVPGVAHNSADCGKIVWMDPNTPIPTKPDHLLTGSERNVLRNISILWGYTRPPVPPGATWVDDGRLVRPTE